MHGEQCLGDGWQTLQEKSEKILQLRCILFPHIVLRHGCMLPAANIYFQFRRHVFLVGCQNITIEPYLVHVP